MPIPKEVLAVKRPVNSIVCAYGKNRDKFLVRKHIGCKLKDGRHLPVNGPTIGHIVNLEYIPIQKDKPSVSVSNVQLKDWADYILCDTLFKPMIEELCNVFSLKDALRIYCISILRVCQHGIKDYELSEFYDDSFLSELYPGVALSKNTVSKFFSDLGKSCSKIIDFMKNRTQKIGIDTHLLVDGTLKSNESKVNSLSGFSRKAKVKGSKDISVIYAFDLEKSEPVCSMCFPGNMLDLTAYETFISKNGIKKGIIIADKGFPSSKAERQFAENKDLHFLNPIKRNSNVIKAYGLREYENLVDGFEGVLYKKVKLLEKDKWLYSFRSQDEAAKEEKDWLARRQKDQDYSNEEFEEKKKGFGTIILESDLDLDVAEIYRMYGKRWEIETVMRYYKSACEFDETRVHGDYSVIGSEFCDFLSSVLTYKLINKFDSEHLLEKETYKRIMSCLHKAKKIKEDGEWKLVKINPSIEKTIQKLKIIEGDEECMEKPKRGRPKKVI